MTDGRIGIASNTVENTSHAIALNRKNALFASHDAGAGAGAENSAVIASLI